MSLIIQVSGGIVQNVFCEDENLDSLPDVVLVDYDTQVEKPYIGIMPVDQINPNCDVAKDIAEWRKF